MKFEIAQQAAAVVKQYSMKLAVSGTLSCSVSVAASVWAFSLFTEAKLYCEKKKTCSLAGPQIMSVGESSSLAELKLLCTMCYLKK